jgi:hypothetical protein
MPTLLTHPDISGASIYCPEEADFDLLGGGGGKWGVGMKKI